MRKQRILVVDDSSSDRRIITDALASEGYELDTAEDGEEALAKAFADRPDLILLDVVMPKTNGFQVCRRLKMTPETKEIRVILVTSKDQETDRYWGMRQGADDYLVKPFGDEELRQLVARQL